MAGFGRGTPRARASAEAASAGCAWGICFAHPSPQGCLKGTRRPRLQPASSFRALRAAHRSRSLLRLHKGGTLQGTMSAQQSADRSTRPAAGLPPPRAGLPAPFPSPWGRATSRRCALGSLLWPHPPRRGSRCAAGCARCTDSFNVSGQAEVEYSHAVEPIKGTPRDARWLRHP